MKIPAALLLIPIATACAAGSGPTETARATPMPTPSPAGVHGLPAGMLDEVIAQAEAETGRDRSEIGVVVAEAVTWSDGSIGCPQEGMMYTQALVPGYRVILGVAGEELAYHAARDGQFFPCGRPQPAAAG